MPRATRLSIPLGTHGAPSSSTAGLDAAAVLRLIEDNLSESLVEAPAAAPGIPGVAPHAFLSPGHVYLPPRAAPVLSTFYFGR